jgi:hypothetical protein
MVTGRQNRLPHPDLGVVTGGAKIGEVVSNVRPIQIVSVIPSLPAAIEGLREAACKLHWS